MKLQRLRQHAKPFQSLAALLLLIIGLSLTTDRFLTPENGLNVLRQISVNVCLSTGMTLVILSGGIDLSVGSVMALAGAMTAWLLKHPAEFPQLGIALQFTLFGAVVVGLAVGAILGAFNGFAVTKLSLPPFVATLAMLSIARGLTYLWTAGRPVTGLGSAFGWLGTGTVLRVPLPAWISIAVVLIVWIASRRTRFGRHVFAVGGNQRAALLSGVPVDRVKRRVYMLAGLFSGLAGVLLTARLDAASPAAGEGYELDSIAAVVIGGASLSGGKGSVLGTLLGCILIGVLNNGLVLLEVTPFWQQVVKGAVILIAVAIDQAQSKHDA